MQKVFPLDFGLRPEHVFVRFIIVIYSHNNIVQYCATTAFNLHAVKFSKSELDISIMF